MLVGFSTPFFDVVGICATSFFAYHVIHVIVALFEQIESLKPYWKMSIFVVTFITVINSSLSLFFYLLITKFRSTLISEMRNLQCRLSSASSTLPVSYTHLTLPTTAEV